MRFEKVTSPSFIPKLRIIDDDETILSEFSLEVIQDLKYGDWAGNFGPPSKSRTDEEVRDILTEMLVNDHPTRETAIRILLQDLKL